jgi:hypothetical protein
MHPDVQPRRQRRLLGVSLLAFSLLVFTCLASGNSWIDVFVATFDRSTSDPSTWADIGTMSTVPTRWGHAAGDSGPQGGSFLLTSRDGDPTVDIGISGTFTTMPTSGVVVTTFDLLPEQDDAVFKTLIGLDRGADIVGLTFKDDGTIQVPGRPEIFTYHGGEPYHITIAMTWTAASTVKADMSVVDKLTSQTVASWSFVIDQTVIGFNRLSLVRQGGTSGSFILDSIDAAWSFSNPGH